jgi:hypothetical protein
VGCCNWEFRQPGGLFWQTDAMATSQPEAWLMREPFPFGVGSQLLVANLCSVTVVRLSVLAVWAWHTKPAGVESDSQGF